MVLLKVTDLTPGTKKKEEMATGCYRYLFKVFNKGDSKEAHDAIQTVMETLQEVLEQFNEEAPDEIVWKGISKDGDYYTLWIQQPRGEFIKEEQYRFKFRRPCAEIFDNLEGYIFGVNICIDQV